MKSGLGFILHRDFRMHSVPVLPILPHVFRLKRICCKLFRLADFPAGIVYRLVMLVVRGADISFHSTVKTWHARNLRLGHDILIDKDCLLDAPGRSRIELGDRAILQYGTQLITQGGKGISIGARTTINRFCIIYGTGGVRIGRDCLIAPMCVIVAASHRFDDPGVPIRKQGQTARGITIGDNCWLGARVTVLDGVTIGDGCVIGAGAVVSRDLPPNSVAVGVPARVIRQRGARPAADLHTAEILPTPHLLQTR